MYIICICIFLGCFFSNFTSLSVYADGDSIDLESGDGSTLIDIIYGIASGLGYSLKGINSGLGNAWNDVVNNIMMALGYETYNQTALEEMMAKNVTINEGNLITSEQLSDAILSALVLYGDVLGDKIELSDYIYKGYPDLANTTTYFPTALDYESTPNMSNPLAVSSWKYFLETYPNEMKLIMDTIKDCDYLWISFQSFYGTGSEDAQHPVYGMCISYIPQDYVERNAIVAVKNSGSGKHNSQKFYSYNKTYFNFSDVPMNYIIFMFDNYSPSISSRFCTLTGYDNVLTNQFVYVNDSYYYNGNVSYPVYNEINAFMQWTYIYDDSSSYASASYYYFFLGVVGIISSIHKLLMLN